MRSGKRKVSRGSDLGRLDLRDTWAGPKIIQALFYVRLMKRRSNKMYPNEFSFSYRYYYYFNFPRYTRPSFFS